MKELWTATQHCLGRAACVACRTDDRFRSQVGELFEFDGVCPIGLPVGFAGPFPVVEIANGQPGRIALPVARTEGERAACLAVCDDCPDARLGSTDEVSACVRLGSCGGAPACERRFQEALTGGHCPRGLWPAVGAVGIEAASEAPRN